MFGSLKNYFSGKSGDQPRTQEAVPSNPVTRNPLTDTIDQTRSEIGVRSPDDHPGNC